MNININKRIYACAYIKRLTNRRFKKQNSYIYINFYMYSPSGKTACTDSPNLACTCALVVDVDLESNSCILFGAKGFLQILTSKTKALSLSPGFCFFPWLPLPFRIIYLYIYILMYLCIIRRSGISKNEFLSTRVPVHIDTPVRTHTNIQHRSFKKRTPTQ